MMGQVTGKRVLLVDADGLPRRALAEQLDGLGYTVVSAESAAGARDLAGECDLLVLGGGESEEGVRELCRSWRVSHGASPLALIEGQASPDALEADGAVVMVKPVRLAELARKLQEIAPQVAASVLAIGGLRFHPVTRELIGGADAPVRLTEREAAILAYLHRSPGRTVPREELLGQVLGYVGEAATHTLETHIYRLRRKLAAAAARAPRLVSEDKGYRLVPAESDPVSNDR